MALVRRIRDTLGCQFEGRNAQLLVAQNKQGQLVKKEENRRCAHRHLKSTHKTRKTGDREKEREKICRKKYIICLSVYSISKKADLRTGSNKEQQQKEKT